ncbi:MAG: hypothetical protein ACRC10_01610 [Thermoguttaceae bacterium]
MSSERCFMCNHADSAVLCYAQVPKVYNCAQAVAKGFQRDDLVETLKSAGGGNAPENLCGALYSALSLVPSQRHESVKQRFRDAVGSLHCREIRGAGVVPCSECVRIAATVIDELPDGLG